MCHHWQPAALLSLPAQGCSKPICCQPSEVLTCCFKDRSRCPSASCGLVAPSGHSRRQARARQGAAVHWRCSLYCRLSLRPPASLRSLILWQHSAGWYEIRAALCQAVRKPEAQWFMYLQVLYGLKCRDGSANDMVSTGLTCCSWRRASCSS